MSDIGNNFNIDEDFAFLLEAYERGDELSDFEFLVFKKYLLAIENFLEDETNKYEIVFKAMAEKMGVEQLATAIKLELRPRELDYAYFYSEMAEFYRNTFRQSAFVSLIALVEANFVSVVEMWDEDLNHSATTFEKYRKRHRGINLLKLTLLYQNKFHGIRIPLDDNSIWSEIENFIILRNCIVHNLGILDENTRRKQKLAVFIQDCPFLSVAKDNKVVLDKKFCQHAHDIFGKFILLRNELCNKRFSEITPPIFGFE